MEKDVVQVLTENHAVLGWLAERLQGERAAAAVEPLLFNEFARALGGHQTVIDQTVIPALKSCGWRGVTSDVLTGHVALKRSLAELLTLKRDDGRFREALKQLSLQLAAQRECERVKLLPVLRKCLDDGQRALMAFDAELHLTRIFGATRLPLDEVDLSQGADDLIAEAQVVLASLPSAPPHRPLH